MTIVCEGTNKVTGNKNGIDVPFNLTISGSGSLSVKGETEDGIHTKGTIKISNNAGLSVEAGKNGIYTNSGQSQDGKIDINTKGNITVKSNDGSGIVSDKGAISITSEQGSVDIVGGKKAIGALNSRVKISAAENVGITGRAESGITTRIDVDIKAGKDITVTAKKEGIYVCATLGLSYSGKRDVTLNAGGNIAVKSETKGIVCEGTELLPFGHLEIWHPLEQSSVKTHSK